MNYNTDGFNERTSYIHTANDINKLRNEGPSNIDSSFAKMKIAENKPDIESANRNKVLKIEEPRGSEKNFVLRTYNMINTKPRTNFRSAPNKSVNGKNFKKF